jgi:thiol-disulfide isomerase/thioredoxin
MVNMLATVAEFDQACASTNLTVIDFTATWCPPCQMIGPKFVAMAGEAGFSGVSFLKLDVDANDQASAKAGITCMPTFQCWRDGKKVDELQGADENALRAMITKNM